MKKVIENAVHQLEFHIIPALEEETRPENQLGYQVLGQLKKLLEPQPEELTTVQLEAMYRDYVTLENRLAPIAREALEKWVPAGETFDGFNLNGDKDDPCVIDGGDVDSIRNDDGCIWIMANGIEYRLKDLSQADVIAIWEHSILNWYEEPMEEGQE